jgi:hypothetical protein
LSEEVEQINARRKLFGQDPMNGKENSKIRELGTATVVADQERMIAEGKAAEERANKASRLADDITRTYDPNYTRLNDLRRQQGDLRDALSDPLSRSKLAEQSETEKAYTAASRAIDSMTDSTGKLIDRQEMARRADQLRLDALKASTDGEKAAVAERQKAFNLIGKTVTVGDAAEQIKMAGKLSLAGASDKSKGGGSSSDVTDEFDRATKSLEDCIRRQQQDTETYGMGAAAVARYRTETDLLTAAKRAERDITPDLTASIKAYADRALEAARQQEAMRESMQSIDAYRNVSSEGLRSVIGDLTKGASAADLMRNATGRLTNSLANMASDQIAEGLFGKRGTSGGWLSDLLKPSTASAETGGIGSFFKSIFGYADGGFPGLSADGIISGPGTSRSDSILADPPPLKWSALWYGF